MDDAVNERLVRMLDAIENATVSANGFISDEAPEVARELITWQITSWTYYANVSWGVGVVCLLFSVWCALSLRFGRNGSSENDMDYVFVRVFGGLTCLGIAAVCFGVFVEAKMQVEKGRTAPRVVLIEAVGDFVRGKKR